MKKQVTIQDIAERTQVSKTTVSRYLNGKFDFMSNETKEKIAAAISEMGYRQNRMANSLRTNQSGLIGIVMSNVMSSQTPQLLGSICDTCAEHGIKIIIVNSEKDPEKEKTLVYELLEQRVDGLLVLSGYNLEFYQELDRDEVPVVLADRIPLGCCLDAVAINHAESVRYVVGHLLKQGFERIVVLKKPHRNPYNTPQIRVDAAISTCREFFGDDEHCEVITMDFGSQGEQNCDKYDKLTGILHEYYSKSADCPTAIFVAEAVIMNIVACCYYRAAISINDKFTISGYSDWDMGSLIVPPISTIEQPIKQMGQRATEKLIKRIEQSKKSDTFGEHPVETSLLTCRISIQPKE